MNSSAKLNYLRKPFKKFSNLKLTKRSKSSDEIHEPNPECRDPVIEHFPYDSSNLTGLKGELETAVSHYLSQVRELGIYKDPNPREAPCQFTTFKTPALPRKTIKPTTDEQLLDVKFKLIEDTNSASKEAENSPTYENSAPAVQSLDNPLYLSISECHTGTSDNQKDSFYENISLEHSDEDHIYENVETNCNLYDTVTNPPRPKLPPKPCKSNENINLKPKRKSYSFSSQTKHEILKKENKVVSNNIHKDKGKGLDGSETSDLGSSGSEDTNSEEDWPLPPSPTEIGEVTDCNVPLPPPPPELALQVLDEEVNKVEEKESDPNKRSEKGEGDTSLDQIVAKPLAEKDQNTTPEPKEADDYNSDSNSQFFRTESFSKKHLKSKLFTLNKGLSAYKKASQTKDGETNSQKFVVVDNDYENKVDTTSVRHSVVIELKDQSAGATSQEQLSGAQIKEKLETIDIKVDKENEDRSPDIEGIKVSVKQEDSFTDQSISELNEHVIEISDDGSWEMKDIKSQDINNSQASNSYDIDPITGFPIMDSLQSPSESIVHCKAVVKEYKEPEVYFDEGHSSRGTEEGTGLSLVKRLQSKLEEAAEGSSIKSIIASESTSVSGSSSTEMDSPEEASKQNKHNLGAAIMKEYERDLQRKKDHLNLPEVSLFEFGESARDLEIQRKSVIEQMTVKAKKKDSWIRTFRAPIDPLKNGKKENDESNTKCLENKTKIYENGEDYHLKLLPKVNAIESNEMFKSYNKTNDPKKTEKGSYGSAGRIVRANESRVPEYINQKSGKSDQPFNNEESTNTKISELVKNKKVPKGEVDCGSILNKKSETKTFWETKMMGVDEGGWEPVANVKFRSEFNTSETEETSGAVPPPPEFSADTADSLGSLSSDETIEDDGAPKSAPQQKVINERPSRQYVYGSDEEVKVKKTGQTTILKPTPKFGGVNSPHENVIEAEIREQQLREEALRREKTGGASSPSSHASDEGFVERPIEETPPSPPPAPASSEGFTHTIKGSDGEPVIYDAVSPPSEYFSDKTTSSTGSTSSEAKIALEIRELKEREAELRALREQQLRAMEGNVAPASRSNTPGDEVEEELERSDDPLASFTTTTDEGNFSECGDVVSSEDKSSDGSNSRIMSPDLHSYTNHTENRQRKVTVKPFEDEETEQPVYTQMKKESVIEREIRLAKEREEAFRREKGLLTIAPVSSTKSPVQVPKNAPSTVASNTVVNNNNNNSSSNNNNSSCNNNNSSSSSPVILNPVEKAIGNNNNNSNNLEEGHVPKRGVQHRLATSRIQQEIEETAQRERELRSAGKIITLSEDTVDSKVTRLTDFGTVDQINKSRLSRNAMSASVSSINATTPPPKGLTINTVLHIPLEKRNSSPMSPVRSPSPYSPPNFTPSPKVTSSSNRLTRSLSTNNLSLSGVSSGGLRGPQKGLMQKFIASRGKLTSSTFSSPLSPSASFNGIKHLPVTSNGVPTRPMRVSPKTQVIRREVEDKVVEEKQTTKVYRRTHATAEEKIQEELRDMKKREEELRRIRARNLARSQPNLAAIDDDVTESEALTEEALKESEGVDSSSFLHEMNGLRSALSNPNLLDDEPPPPATAAERGIRRRSALIAQWEGRIQQTAET